MVNFLRQMLRNLDYPNVNELIQKVPQVQELLARAGIEGTSGVPQDAEGLGQMMMGGTTGPMTGSAA